MSRNWKSVMDKSWDAIHSDITAGLNVIKTDFESKGLPFDEKFRTLFCRSISNRLVEVFNIFEMEATESKKSGETRKRNRSISNQSTHFKRLKCGEEILPKWAFACAHCYTTNGQNDWYSSENKVHEHWQGNHSKAKLPFRFYVDAAVRCYRCDFAGFFETVQEHARTKHTKFPVFIKNERGQRECAFCSHRDNDGNIPDHFRRVHPDEIASMNALNLIPFSYRDLMDLNAIGKNDVRRSYFQRSFAEISDLDQHHRAKHPGEQRKCDEIKLICCSCEKSVRSTTFLAHVTECGIFKCNKCRNFRAKTPETFLDHIKDMHSNDLSDGFYSRLRRSLMDKYWSMRCIFENGLVVTKRNLVSCPRFDDSKEFLNLTADSVNELRNVGKTLTVRTKVKDQDEIEAKDIYF